MEPSLKDKNALVCGGSKGIGRAAAEALAAGGANVTVVARHAEELSETVGQLNRQQDQEHDFLAADFTKPGEVRKKMRSLLSGKRIQILLNNTGGPPGGPLLEATTEELTEAFQMHVICFQMITKLVVPGMKETDYGRIINIISTSVKAPIPGLGVSNTIRGAVANWSKTLAGELGPQGITVNNVLPGYTDTGRLRSLIASKAEQSNRSAEEVAAGMRAKVPMGRFGDAREIAAAVAFLASPGASYVNGINIPVDGGRTKSL